MGDAGCVGGRGLETRACVSVRQLERKIGKVLVGLQLARGFDAVLSPQVQARHHPRLAGRVLHSKVAGRAPAPQLDDHDHAEEDTDQDASYDDGDNEL